MRSEVLRLVDLSSEDRARWRELARNAVEPNPFFEPEYLEPLARGLGREKHVLLAVVQESGSWLACSPVVRTAKWHRIPLPGITSWRGHVLFGLLGTPLVLKDSREEVLSALMDAMATARPHPTYLALDWIGADGPIAEGLRGWAEGDGSGRMPIQFERFDRAVVRRRPEDTYLMEAISSKHRAEIRRQRRRLGEALGDEPKVVDRAGSDHAHRGFIALESEGPDRDEWTTLSAASGFTEFFLDMCEEFAADGRLQLLALEANGQNVAMTCNVTAGDTVFGLKTAYASEWASFSPGVLLQAEQLSIFHGRAEAEMLDSCADANNAVINRLFPDRRPIASLVLPAEGSLGLLSDPVLRAARAVRERRS
jgi:CelD/BcsL family acetyltransferase involved in cellulose biosynthesis